MKSARPAAQIGACRTASGSTLRFGRARNQGMPHGAVSPHAMLPHMVSAQSVRSPQRAGGVAQVLLGHTLPIVVHPYLLKQPLRHATYSLQAVSFAQACSWGQHFVFTHPMHPPSSVNAGASSHEEVDASPASPADPPAPPEPPLPALPPLPVAPPAPALPPLPPLPLPPCASVALASLPPSPRP